MPTRKISNSKEDYCRDADHNPPSHQVFEPGVYEHVCPSCGKRIIFTVARPTL